MLTTIRNFRDFGGFRVPGGGRVTAGRLLRSAHPTDASDQDMAALGALSLSTIVDLRRPTERREQGDRRPPGFSGLVIASEDGDLGEAPHVEFMRGGDTSPAAIDAYLMGYYRSAPYVARHRDLFARTFEALQTTPGALLIHCTAGKDRTGLLVALIRTALGGDFKETLADYLATNAVALTPINMDKARESILTITGSTPNDDAVRAFVGVWGHHLEAAFDEIRSRSGSIDIYLAELGLDATARSRLRRNLIDDASWANGG